MIVRELIEHLAQQEQDRVVKLRDPLYPTVLIDIEPHAVSVEEFLDRGNLTAAEARQRLISGELKSSLVVAIG